MAEFIDREKLADGLKEWQNRLIETYGKNDEYVRCLNSVLFSVDNAPAADVVPWETLMRYANYFCAAVSFPEFVREAKMFYDSTKAAMDGGNIE